MASDDPRHQGLLSRTCSNSRHRSPEIPAATNPISGGDCAAGQEGDVWFLAGTAGGSDTRSCTIPAGRAIFFPIINSILMSCPEVWGEEDCDWTEEAYLSGVADDFLGYDIAMSVTVDGESIGDLTSYSARSGMFGIDYTLSEPSWQWYPQCTEEPDCLPPTDFECLAPWAEDNVCGIPAGTAKQYMSVGYWIMLEPLAPGAHTTHFDGTLNPDDPWFSLDVTYNITVE